MAEQLQWHHINTDDTQALAQARENYNLTAEQTGYAGDRYERAHVEYDALAKTFLLVFNIPDADVDAAQEEQHQMTFLIKDEMMLSFGHVDASKIVRELEQTVAVGKYETPYQFLLEALYLVTERFMPLVQKADAARHEVQQELRQKTTRKMLLELSNLETNALYLGNAAKQNESVLEQLKGITVYHGFTPAEKERLEDVLIEAGQLVEMTQLGSQNLSQLEGTYNNILNNNLNDTMKFLTIWSIVLTAPTIISGFFGQNVPVPFEHSPQGWLVSIGLAVLLSAIFALLMSRYIRK
ncbi:magnesium transporter CorA family protein [Lacticaseibacillus zhaodongensis]|uniref:magnesium transporter CorA family protein n=1 Tax=Lacticaseibacillus zhaodongensis TaxID=2668065 RepID=UPI0012D35DA3|nr:magnesium transporter CorA family protein [Lacticaseibacillus zhaodongensis]